MQWTVLIPAKGLPEAKSRLAARGADPATHGRLVEALRADTVTAAQAAGGVARVVVVADRADTFVPLGVELYLQRGAGLNTALAEAAEHAERTWPADGVAALLGDLPALRPDELGEALNAAGQVATAFVADASGSGTTLLTASAGHRLAPEFGPGSAARHARVARRLDASPGLRHDVDTADDLEAVLALGVGRATAAALRAEDEDETARSRCTGIVGA